MSTHRRIPWFLLHRATGASRERVGTLLVAIVSALSVSACQTQSTSSDNSVGQTRQAVEAAPDSAEPTSPSAAVPPSAVPMVPAASVSVVPAAHPPDLGAGIATVTRLTADGEPTVAQVPAAQPSVEVPEGAPCGIADPNGVLQSCQPGTYCASEGGTARCVKAPVAPRWDG